jgi:hypothetical protein
MLAPFFEKPWPRAGAFVCMMYDVRCTMGDFGFTIYDFGFGKAGTLMERMKWIGADAASS